MMCIFIPWDIAFTNSGIWGFNPTYLTGISFLGLPLEEWLFFLCIPYACLFTHYALEELFPRMAFRKKTMKVIYFSLVTALVLILWYQYEHWYTLVNFSFALVVLGIAFNYFQDELPRFFATYLIILIPFFLVNGILTGTGIEEQVVWYNNAENLGIRMGTIPVEDTIYNLGMLLTVFLVMKKLEPTKEY